MSWKIYKFKNIAGRYVFDSYLPKNVNTFEEYDNNYIFNLKLEIDSILPARNGFCIFFRDSNGVNYKSSSSTSFDIIKNMCNGTISGRFRFVKLGSSLSIKYIGN